MDDLTRDLIEFRDARGWARYHTPENLAAAISVEAAELLERFQWGQKWHWGEVCEELADVLIYALTMCHALGVTPESIVRRKMDLNATKYPAKEAPTW